MFFSDQATGPSDTVTVPKPDALKTWLENLPLANSDFCFDAVLTILRRLNTHPDIPPATRLELADILRPDVMLLAQRTEDRFLDAPLPYTTENARQAETGTALHRELARLYAAACAENRALSLWPGHNPNLMAAYRGFQHYGLTLLRTAQLYREIDREFWAELYRLYRRVENQQLATERLQDPEEPSACLTPLGQFQRALLFEMADYYRYRQRDMRTIFAILGELGNESDWHHHPTLDGQPARFYVDLDSRRGPVRIHGACQAQPSARFLFINRLTRKLLDKSLPQRSDLLGKTSARTRLPMHLAKSLYGTTQRKSARLPLNQKCLLFVGLNNLVRVLSPPPPPRTDNKAPAIKPMKIDWTKRSGLELLPMENNLFGRIPERELRTDAVIERILMDHTSHMEDIWDDSDPLTLQRGAEGELLNTNSHGYCVLWCDQGNPHIQVGALIGIAEQQRPPYIGVIRWLMVVERSLRFGVELITPQAEVVQIWDNTQHSKGKGLFLPPLKGLRPAPEILVSPSGFHGGALVHLRGTETQDSMYLGKIREATFSFTHYALLPGQPEMEPL